MDQSFQVKKWEAYFKKIDTNGDGLISTDDVGLLCEKVASAAGVSLTEDMRQDWIAVFSTVFGNDKVNLEELKEELQKLDAREDRIEIMTDVGMPLFKAIDINNDGMISIKEYKAFVIPLGATEEEADVGFKMIDENGNGFLSHEEFAAARAHYFFDREDNQYKHFYGHFSN